MFCVVVSQDVLPVLRGAQQNIFDSIFKRGSDIIFRTFFHFLKNSTARSAGSGELLSSSK